MKKIILFMCETWTLAHILRSLSLASALNKSEIEIHFAANEVPDFVADQMKGFKHWPLYSSVPSKLFIKALSKGTLPFTFSLIQSQVEEDISLISKVKPDLIIGDVRHSLLISAKICNVPYLNITNITWSPMAKIPLQVPDLASVRFFGEKISRFVFSLIQPFMYWWFARPFNRVAKKYGQQSLGSLYDIYCGGDYVFYADHSKIIETAQLPKNHHFGGPTPGQINMQLTSASINLTQEPLVLVCLGSSGPQHLLPKIIEGLSKLPVQVLISTCGYKMTLPSYPHIKIVDFLPIDSLLKKTSVLISNGGSPTSYAAVTNGIPFLAIPSNLDQFNVTAAFVERGIALRLRPEEVKPQKVKAQVQKLLLDETIRAAAQQLSFELAKSVSSKLYFKTLITNILENQPISPEGILNELTQAPKSNSSTIVLDSQI